MFKSEVKSISQVLSKTLRENGLETPLLQLRLISSWEKVVGKAIDKYTQDKYIKNQTLFVKVLNPALKANLSMSRSKLVASLNKIVGSNVIQDIRFY